MKPSRRGIIICCALGFLLGFSVGKAIKRGNRPDVNQSMPGEFLDYELQQGRGGLVLPRGR